MNHCKNHPRRPLAAESVSLCEQCLTRQRKLTGVKRPRRGPQVWQNADLSRPARVVAKELGVSHTTVLNHRNKS